MATFQYATEGGLKTFEAPDSGTAQRLMPSDALKDSGVQQLQEPAVISSDTIRSKVIPENDEKLDAMSNKGTSVGKDGNVYYADNSMVPAPEGATYNEKTGFYEYAGKSYGVSDFYDSDDEDYKAIQSLLEPLKASLDRSTLGQVGAIEQQYDMLRSEQREINKRAEQARSRSLLLGGSSRYAPLASASTMQAQMNFGLRQIQKIDAQENMAIAQARAAQEEGNFKLLDKALGMAESARKEKQSAAAEMMKQIQEANEKLAERRGLIERDESVADLMAQGITNPAEIIKHKKANG
ncbi:MAG: hypothetical protein AAB964_00885, partial [Patescibacteria group bacterium]